MASIYLYPSSRLLRPHHYLKVSNVHVFIAVNSWDRQVWEWLGEDGKPTWQKKWDNLYQNIMFGEYQVQEG